MIENLLIGFPYDRPGGLALSVIYFLVASGTAISLGFIYCFICTNFRYLSWLMQLISTLIRGVPLLLLMFLCAHIPVISTGLAGLFALTVYSLTHVGEILRGFMNSYPKSLTDQARAMGLGRTNEWISVRIPWVVSHSLPALLTHWVSLLKDSGALIVISIGELTTVTKSLSESSRDFADWAGVLLLAALFYFVSTLILIKVVNYFGKKLIFKEERNISQKTIIQA